MTSKSAISFFAVLATFLPTPFAQAEDSTAGIFICGEMKMRELGYAVPGRVIEVTALGKVPAENVGDRDIAIVCGHCHSKSFVTICGDSQKFRI